MKRILYLSHSPLNKNMFEFCLSLLTKKWELHYAKSSQDVPALSGKQSFHLVVFDEDILEESSSDWVGMLEKPAFKNANRIALHTRQTLLKQEDYSELGLSGAHLRPLLADDLATLVENSLGGKS